MTGHLLILIGIGLTVWGVSMWSVPAAVVLSGVYLAMVGKARGGNG